MYDSSTASLDSISAPESTAVSFYSERPVQHVDRQQQLLRQARQRRVAEAWCCVACLIIVLLCMVGVFCLFFFTPDVISKETEGETTAAIHAKIVYIRQFIFAEMEKLMFVVIPSAVRRNATTKDAAIQTIPEVTQSSEPSGYEKTLKRLTEDMDPWTDPCTDFYQFSCGNWVKGQASSLKKHEGLNRMDGAEKEANMKIRQMLVSDRETSSKAIEMVKTVYTKCISEEKADVQRRLIDTIKNLHLTSFLHGSKLTNLSMSLPYILNEFFVQSDVPVFFKVSVKPDRNNQARNLIHFEEQEPDFIDEDDFPTKQEGSAAIKKKREEMINMISTFCKVDGGPCHKGAIEKEVDQILKFEKQLADISGVLKHKSGTYTKKSMLEVESIIRKINLSHLLWYNVPNAHELVAPNSEVVFPDLDYFHRLSELLDRTDLKVIANYIAMQYVKAAKLDQTKEEREVECFDLVREKWNLAVQALYIRSVEFKKIADSTMKIANNVQNHFIESVKKNNDIDSKTKKTLLENLEKHAYGIENGDLLESDARLNNYYVNVDIKKEDSIEQILKKQYGFLVQKAYQTLLDGNSEKPTKTNSMRTFPATFLQDPFFDSENPMSVNYGGFGAVIARELIMEFLEAVTEKDMWEKLYDIVECLKHQNKKNENSTSIVPAINPEKTFSSLEAIHYAYKTFLDVVSKEELASRITHLEHFNQHQLFFISFGRMHCEASGHEVPKVLKYQTPSKRMLNQVLRNQPDFVKTFNCPVASPMNEEKKCGMSHDE